MPFFKYNNSSKNDIFFHMQIYDPHVHYSTSWGAKKSGNPLVVRGGYNCRHQWSYVNPDWYDKQGELII